MERQILKATEFLKAKYTKRWKGKDGKWRYEYVKPKGKGRSKKAGTAVSTGAPSPPSNAAHPAEKVFPGIKVERVLKRRVDFNIKGKLYSITAGGVIAKRTPQSDGKNWYSYQTDFAMSDEDKLLEYFSVSRAYNSKRKQTEHTFK